MANRSLRQFDRVPNVRRGCNEPTLIPAFQFVTLSQLFINWLAVEGVRLHRPKKMPHSNLYGGPLFR